MAQAINDLGARLENSLGQLASSTSISYAELASEQNKVGESLSAELQLLREQGVQDSAGRGKHELLERELLEKIQRQRRL